MKKIIVIIVLAAVIVFGYYAYQSLVKSTGGISVENVKGLIQNKANETKNKMEGTVDENLQDLKDQTGDVIKNKVDETLGTN